jgi:hypothetical protein
VFDPAKNNFHQHGKATRWVLKMITGNLIGRIAAFINNKKAYNYEQPTGGCGFFECIDNKQAAFLLFDTAKNGCRKMACRPWMALSTLARTITFGDYW